MSIHITAPQRLRRLFLSKQGSDAVCQSGQGADSELDLAEQPSEAAKVKEARSSSSQISLLAAWRNLWLP